jgi:hypothetical protein
MSDTHAAPQRVFVFYHPTRTREHSKTYFDFVNDFWVPRTKVAAVCIGVEDANAVWASLRLKLEEAIPRRGMPPAPYEYRPDWAIWNEFLNVDLVNAIQRDSFLGDADHPFPTEVGIVLRHNEFRAWDGSMHIQYRAVRVSANGFVIGDYLRDVPRRDRDFYSVVRMPITRPAVLIG